jgi:hypothetical protein
MVVKEEKYFKHATLVINGKNKNIYKTKNSNAKFVKHCKKYISIAEFKKVTKPKKKRGGDNIDYYEEAKKYNCTGDVLKTLMDNFTTGVITKEEFNEEFNRKCPPIESENDVFYRG